jgi:hypothetical protein
MRITLKSVNEALAGLGTRARLVKGDGYFYFDSGEAETWLDKTVSAPTLSSRTVDEWVGEYQKLKSLNEKLVRSSSGAMQASRSKDTRPGRSRKL